MPSDSSSVSNALKFTVWGMGVVLLGGMLFLASAIMGGKTRLSSSSCTMDAQHVLPEHSSKNITYMDKNRALIELTGEHTTLMVIDLCSGAIHSKVTLQ